MRPSIHPSMRHAAAKEAHRRGWLNFGLGWALMKDRRLSAWTKIAAVAAGAGATALLVAFEVPLEAMVAALVPLLGMAADFAFDGLEVALFPILLSLLFVRWFAPKEIVELHIG